MEGIRDSILEEMLKSGLTIYQVSKMVEDKIPQRTVYAFLAGEKDTGTETASIIMKVLGLTISTKFSKITFKERSRNMVGKDYQVKKFENDDDGYLRWLRHNPTGFVLNSYRQPSSEYLILHRSTCVTISTDKRINWTTTGFIKICSLEIEELEKWAQNKVGGKLHHCSFCKP